MFGCCPAAPSYDFCPLFHKPQRGFREIFGRGVVGDHTFEKLRHPGGGKGKDGKLGRFRHGPHEVQHALGTDDAVGADRAYAHLRHRDGNPPRQAFGQHFAVLDEGFADDDWKIADRTERFHRGLEFREINEGFEDEAVHAAFGKSEPLLLDRGFNILGAYMADWGHGFADRTDRPQHKALRPCGPPSELRSSQVYGGHVYLKRAELKLVCGKRVCLHKMGASIIVALVDADNHIGSFQICQVVRLARETLRRQASAVRSVPDEKRFP